MNWVLDVRGQDVLSGLPLLWGPEDEPANGAYFQTLSSLILTRLMYSKLMMIIPNFVLKQSFFKNLYFKIIEFCIKIIHFSFKKYQPKVVKNLVQERYVLIYLKG